MSENATEESTPLLPLGRALLILAALAIVAYLPTLAQPFISDDFPNILQSRVWGPVSGWSAMAADQVSRVRATSWILTYWIERAFGLRPAAFYAVSILFHVFNTWLVYALGRWRLIGWRIAFFAAAFFAVLEGHQEAVMWYAAINELLLFFFAMICLLAWIGFINAPEPRWGLLSLSFFSFVLTLASKESAVIIVPLLFLPLLRPTGPVVDTSTLRKAVWITPYAVLGVVYALSIYRTRQYSFRFQDGSFSLHAPVWITLPNTLWRMFWPWGFVALIAIAAWHARTMWRLVGAGVLWAAIALVPYSFLIYMTRVPSRQTYLASLGVAWVLGAGALAFMERFRNGNIRWLYALAAVVILHNVIYLWTKKRSQFLERAASTQALVEFARHTDGPVYIPCSAATGWGGCACFPYAPLVAQSALELETSKPEPRVVWSSQAGPSAAQFCWNEKVGKRVY